VRIPILIEPVADNGFRAKTGAPFELSADGATRDEAIDGLRQLLQNRLNDGAQLDAIDVPSASQPNAWTHFAGMFKDDPYFDEWQQAIAENRARADQCDDEL
jgi:predicted RNase H-like HicB family nuclease